MSCVSAASHCITSMSRGHIQVSLVRIFTQKWCSKLDIHPFPPLSQLILGPMFSGKT